MINNNNKLLYVFIYLLLSVLLTVGYVCNGNGDPPETPDTPPVYLDMTPIGQRYGNWCWAACMQMCVVRPGSEVSLNQCQIAVSVLQRRRDFSSACGDFCDCDNLCSTILDGDRRTPLRESCNWTSWPDFNAVDYTATTLPSALGWDDIKSEIDSDRPFCDIYLNDDRVTSHMIVISGYRVYQGEQKVYQLDPQNNFPDNAGVIPVDANWILLSAYNGRVAYPGGPKTYYKIQKQSRQ